MTKPLSSELISDQLWILEKIVALSVDLHNLNAGFQRRYHISVVQWLVLEKIIDHPGLSAGTLAEISGVHPSTLTPTIARLESMGLIYIQERSSDQRRKLLVASWKGYECRHNTKSAFSKALTNAGIPMIESDKFESVRGLSKQLLSIIRQEQPNTF